MKIKDFISIVEEFAPVKLKESYDNVGLMVGDKENEITNILVALDCTNDVIEEAKTLGCNLIITHHPLLFKKPSTITTDTLVGRKVIELIKSDICLYSSHTNLDSVEGGINDLICSILQFENTNIIQPAEDISEYKAGIGRIMNLENMLTLGELCDRVKSALAAEVIRYSGDKNKSIWKLAIINGSGQDYISLAISKGADCIITGDTTYHYISDYAELGIAVIDAGHFSTEWPAMKVFGKKLEQMLRQSGFENSLLISNSSKDPYKYI